MNFDEVSKLRDVKKYLDNIKENGTLLINTNDTAKCLSKICKEDLDIIKNKHLKVLTIDAESIASKNNIKGKISKIMETIILNLFIS